MVVLARRELSFCGSLSAPSPLLEQLPTCLCHLRTASGKRSCAPPQPWVSGVVILNWGAGVPPLAASHVSYPAVAIVQGPPGQGCGWWQPVSGSLWAGREEVSNSDLSLR